MDRVSARQLSTAILLVREPVVVTYSYPRNHPLYGAGRDCGVFVPMAVWATIVEHNDQYDLGTIIAKPGIRLADGYDERDQLDDDDKGYEQGYQDGIDAKPEDIEE